MSDEVTLYTSQTCGPCRRLKHRLEEAEVAFREVDINDAPAAARRIEEVTGGFRIVPTVEIGGSLLVNPDVGEVVSRAAAT